MPPDAPGKILVPRWVQLVGLPLAIVGVWLLVSAVNHAVFVFVVAALIAILLNPIVRAFCALRIPRGVSVLLVYLFFAFVVSGMSVIVGTVIAREVQDVANQVEDQFKENSAGVTPADRRLADLQRWIDDSSPVKVDVKAPGERLLNSIDVAHLQRYSGRAVDVARSLVITLFESLFNLVLVIVISVYMPIRRWSRRCATRRGGGRRSARRQRSSSSWPGRSSRRCRRSSRCALSRRGRRPR